LTGRQIELYRKYRDYGFELVAIDLYRHETESTRRYIQEKGIDYPVLIANDQVLASYGGIKDTPTMFLLDREGRIVEVFEQFNKKELFKIESKIRHLLGLGPLPPPADLTSQADLAPLRGSKAPDFRLSTLQGGNISLASLSNRVVMLIFWSIDDPVSVGLLPVCQKIFYEKYHPKGLEVIGIHIHLSAEAKAKATRFVQDNQLQIPIVQATPDLVRRYRNIDKTPVIMLIDRQGSIREIYEGFNSGMMANIKGQLVTLIQEAGAER